MTVEQRSVLAEKIEPGRRVAPLTIGMWLAAAVGIAGFLWLALYNLGYSPVPWFDEGEHLRVPKTLVQYGQYAVWSADGFRYFGPTIGVGPTVLLPIALVFKLFGIGLVQARLVIVAYLMVAAALYWWIGRRLWESTILATLSLVLLCVAPGVDFIASGRQGLGEIPALAFFMAGLLIWWRATSDKAAKSPALGWIALASAFWALAAITKSDYGLLLPPTLVLAWLVNFLGSKFSFLPHQPNLKWWAYALPLVMVVGGIGGWYLIILLFLGGGSFENNLNLLRTASGGSAFVFSPPRMLSALKFLFSPDALFGLAVPGLLYGIWLARRTPRLALPVALCIVWLGWFAFASVGWPRYAFPALVIIPLFTSKLIWDVALWLNRKKANLGLILASLFVAGLVIWGLAPQVSDTLKVDDGAQRLAAYLNQNVDKSAVIETWESEMGFLTDHSYHYPPPELLDKAVRRMWLNQNVPPLAQIYQPEKLQPDYLIVGTFGAWNQLYPPSLLTERYHLVGNFGTYNLYQRLK